MEQEIRAIVGSKADYYLKKWRPVLEGKSHGAGFNWAAFFFSGLWLPYRKMYIATLIFFGVILFETILEENFFMGFLGMPEASAALGSLVGLVVAIICGIYGNRWYLSHARKVISHVRSQGLQEDAYLKALSRRGAPI